MNTFLQAVADDLRTKYGNDLSSVVVVFPNKRAGLFFNDALVPRADELVWAPKYVTISDLFRSFTTLKTVDPIEAVCRIFHLYRELTADAHETLDFFYGWGEMILADFEDVDKNLADAQQLFQNISDLGEFDYADALSEEQKNVLERFFSDFSVEKQSKIREKFRRLWNQFYPIYQRLNEDLAAEGTAYEGALYRRVLGDLKQGSVSLPERVQKYVFVGFNVLDRVERDLFLWLKQQGRALFYWDYDLYYTERHPKLEAGRFIRENLRTFGNELPAEAYDNMRERKEIEFVATSSKYAQAAAVAPWLEKHLTPDPKRTAVVLCDENMLLPVLHNLPESVDAVNITKGFPLVQTPPYALVDKYLRELSVSVTPEAMLVELIAQVEKAAKKERDSETGLRAEQMIWHELYNEAFFQTILSLQQLLVLVRRGILSSETTDVVCRLIREMLRLKSIPFHGEPAMGLQIMGVLETRNLDFENVFLLAVNEGTLPKKASNASFIPYIIRREFGLTTYEKKTAVFAYYFYRLIQRASHVRMLYNNATSGMGKSEMSRFMLQMLVEYTDNPIRHFMLNSDQGIASAEHLSVPKPQDLAEKLKNEAGEILLSPSSLNAYVSCQLQFYYRRVLRLKPQEPEPDAIQANQLGTLFHKAAELLYKGIGIPNDKGEYAITEAQLSPFLQEGGEVLFQKYIEQAYAEEVGVIDINPLVTNIVKKFLLHLVNYDVRQCPFIIKGFEVERYFSTSVTADNRQIPVKVGGSIDRFDSVRTADGGTFIDRVLDYKTGGNPDNQVIKDMAKMFESNGKPNRPHYAFQALTYSAAVQQEAPQATVKPALFYVSRAHDESYDPSLRMGREQDAVEDYKQVQEDFEASLQGLLGEIFNPETAFVATQEYKTCEHCDFQMFCQKNN